MSAPADVIFAALPPASGAMSALGVGAIAAALAPATRARLRGAQ